MYEECMFHLSENYGYNSNKISKEIEEPSSLLYKFEWVGLLQCGALYMIIEEHKRDKM